MDSPRASQDATGLRPTTSGSEPSGRWRKRPIVVDAFQLGSAWPDWWAEAHAANRAVTFNKDGRWRGGPDYAEIQTLEGVMRANNGDWIIRGVKGEIYPCKPDVFAETYEPAEAPLAVARERSETVAATGLEADPGCKK